MKITPESLRAIYDFAAEAKNIETVVDAESQSLPRFVRFLARYTSWNSLFGSGVCVLAGKIGRSQALFLDPAFQAPVNDRSVYVASYFFDAARDEFDDRDTKHRDTHRCLAQATLYGVLNHARSQPDGATLRDDAALAQLFAEPAWLKRLRERVSIGYGNGTADDRTHAFRAMGYHLGSEVFADQEFSMIDGFLRKRHPSVVTALASQEIEIVGQKHNCYHWLHIHSGGGGGAEADHFAWAVRGAHRAFEFTPKELHEELLKDVHHGYLEFVDDHRTFFKNVGSDPMPS